MKTKRQSKEYFEVIPLHCYSYTKTLIRFAIRVMIQKSQNTTDIPNFWLANKILRNSLCIYALSYQLCCICFTSYDCISYWFIHLLYIFCIMNGVRMWQGNGNIVLQNISGVTEGVHWVRLHHPRIKSCSFYRNTKMKFSI